MSNANMAINWIKAYAIAIAIAVAGFAGIMYLYADALSRYGLLEGK